MQITVNGEHRGLSPDTCLQDLIAELQLQDKRLAIEVNREIVPRSEFAATRLNDGDVIEIVHAIGGG